MKIGFDAKRAFRNSRGLGNYSRDTIRILSGLNREDTFVLYTPNDITVTSFEYNQANSKVVMPKGLWNVSKSLWRTMGMARDCKREGIDVFHGLSHELPMGIEQTGIRTVVTMHDLIFMKQPELYPMIDRSLYKWKYVNSCRRADKVIAISEQTAEDLVRLLGIDERKITIIYQGCNPLFHLRADEVRREEVKRKYHLPERYVLNVGAVEERKNQLGIVRAMEGMNERLVIVGRETPYQRTLEAYIEEKHLRGKVQVLNGVSMEDLPVLYQMAEVFVYPSYLEGFGIPIVEALTSGVPVIATDDGCFREAGGPDQLYVKPRDTAQLQDAISEVLRNTDERETMRKNGEKHAERFADEHISESIMNVYRQALNE